MSSSTYLTFVNELQNPCLHQTQCKFCMYTYLHCCSQTARSNLTCISSVSVFIIKLQTSHRNYKITRLKLVDSFPCSWLQSSGCAQHIQLNTLWLKLKEKRAICFSLTVLLCDCNYENKTNYKWTTFHSPLTQASLQLNLLKLKLFRKQKQVSTVLNQFRWIKVIQEFSLT